MPKSPFSKTLQGITGDLSLGNRDGRKKKEDRSMQFNPLLTQSYKEKNFNVLLGEMEPPALQQRNRFKEYGLV